MAIQQKLHARLVQKLILTPSLQQAIKLLPMTTLELAELLNQEMVENPHARGGADRGSGAQEQEQAQAAEAAEPEKKPDEKGDTWDDQDYEYFFGEYLDDGYRPRQPQEVKELPPIENTLSSKGSLADHLMWQLNLQAADDETREIGAAIIGNIDDDGYLVASVNEIAALGPLGRRGRGAGARARPGVRSRRRGGARSAGVPAAAAEARSDSRGRPSRRSSATTCSCCRITGSRNSRRRWAARSRRSSSTSRSSGISIRSPGRATARPIRSTSSPTSTSSRPRTATGPC